MVGTGANPPTPDHALDPDEAHIIQALRTRFGMTAPDTKDKLQGMRRNRRTSLQDHANTIEKLAQIGYSRTDEEKRWSQIYRAVSLQDH